MKFLHLADLHIGKSIKEFDLIDDQRYILNKIVMIAEEEKADAVVIAGDVYDRAVPSEEAVRVFDDFIYALSSLHIKILLISGNHDSDERLNFGSRLFEDTGVYFCTKFNGSLKKVVLQDKEQNRYNFYLLPFVKASQVRHFYPDEKIDDYEDAVRTVIEHADINKDEINVIVSHQFVTGRSDSVEFSGSEGLGTINVGLVEQISCSCFDDFDYAALGHIHKAQSVGRETIRYAGTPLKYHFEEVNDLKSVPVVSLGKEKGDISISFRELKPKRDMKAIKGKLEQLIGGKYGMISNDYIYVTLTDENPIEDAMNIMRQYYPNTLQIRYENSHTKALSAVNEIKMPDSKDFSELFSDFYNLMYGIDASEEEMELINLAAKKAGIVNETD